MLVLQHIRIKLKAKANLQKISIFKRDFLAIFVVVANTFVWYTLIYIFMSDIINSLDVTSIEALEISAFFYVGIAFSAILNPIIARRFIRGFFLLSWIVLGTCASATLFIFEIYMPISAFLISLFLGFSIGIGLPSSLAYFADNTNVENRGKLGGIIWAAAGIVTLLISLLFYFFNINILTGILILVVLRISGVLFFFLKPKQETFKLERNPSYSSILNDRHVLLYLIPWIMFCLINWIESPIVAEKFGQEFFRFITFAEFTISGIFAFLGGLFSDLVGRKRIIIIGFIMLGVEYAVLSFSEVLTLSQYIYIFFDGISWGMFAVVFFIVLWGDLARDGLKEKYYVVGGLPYLLASFLEVLIRQNVKSIPVNTTFSLASFFLFLAVLPLIYAPETLPEKKIQERQIREYVEKAKKIAEKETKRKR